MKRVAAVVSTVERNIASYIKTEPFLQDLLVLILYSCLTEKDFTVM